MIQTTCPATARLVKAASVIALAALLTACSTTSPGEDGLNGNGQTTPLPTGEPDSRPALPPVASEAGVSDTRILFGQSAAFSGPTQELGRNMRLGIEAAFEEVNEQGGVHGRKLALFSLDDGYKPEPAIANTINLIEQEKVFALIGAVGTPTSRSAAPVARDAGVPYVAPFTGAAFLRDPELFNVINLRASYYQETEEMVARLTVDLGVERIAVVYQDDSYGLAGYTGVLLALERREMVPVAIGVYPRNTTAIKTALLELRQGNPQAVIIIGAYQPVAALIAWSRHTGLDPIFMTVSFVGSNALAKELGPQGTGVYVTQVVPFPTDSSLEVIRAYHKALSEHAPDAVPGFVSLEGYLAGRLSIAVLEACGEEPTRACFLEILRGSSVIDIDGFELRYGEGDNQGSEEVFLTVIGEDGSYLPVETLRDVSP